jgi:hypothetical protein
MWAPPYQGNASAHSCERGSLVRRKFKREDTIDRRQLRLIFNFVATYLLIELTFHLVDYDVVTVFAEIKHAPYGFIVKFDSRSCIGGDYHPQAQTENRLGKTYLGFLRVAPQIESRHNSDFVIIRQGTCKVVGMHLVAFDERNHVLRQTTDEADLELPRWSNMPRGARPFNRTLGRILK